MVSLFRLTLRAVRGDQGCEVGWLAEESKQVDWYTDTVEDSKGSARPKLLTVWVADRLTVL